MRIISQSPARISLFGGGSDLPSYYEKNGGVVISMAINLRTNIEFYTKDDIFQNPGTHFPYNANPDLYYSILNSMGIGGGHLSASRSSFDGVIGAGLGSSASFSVALISAINKTRGERLDRREIAELAWQAEQRIGRITGKQDQYASAFGGFNVILFRKDKKIEILPYGRSIADHMLSYMNLFYIGGTRESTKLQKSLIKPTLEQLSLLDDIKDSAFIAQKAILEGKMEIVGKLMNYSWEAKKKLNPNISTGKIDFIYEYARENGAMGGKICGAGSCGYFLFLVSPEKRSKFNEAMAKKNLEPTDFSYDWQGLDARIL